LLAPGGRIRRTQIVAAAVIAGSAIFATGCSSSASGSGRPGTILAVGAENEYANVIAQVGGRYVTVSAVLSNPNTDPHTFEASPQVAEAVGAASLVVQNGLGYDGFMNKIEGASPSAHRKVIDVQQLLGLPASTPNPHLWYLPTAMPAVAKAVGGDLATLEPLHAAYFRSRVASFDKSLGPWLRAITALKERFPRDTVATTEPVADYLLEACGIRNLTSFRFQADVMNGLDPAPQDISYEETLFTDHKVQAFVYNRQVTDTLTESLETLAEHNSIPVVGVYETMPTPGYDYQTWMLAEVRALTKAFGTGASSPRL
jgi:zinc/manganese transport system substrate-binding protein